jgi:hypothetical protein
MLILKCDCIIQNKMPVALIPGGGGEAAAAAAAAAVQ